ncbi:MAG: type 2 isopentenyl-diphosphate Delta-isomerase [Gammaproteobacteria bacterium]|nr:type 2 isopentenyl-diphosphate Delta-isomerase [Gammaproteobacteria bacterium]
MDDATRDPASKLRHIEACLTRPVEYRKSAGFDAYDFVNEALPELSLGSLDLTCELAGHRLRAPLMIAPMTGGTERGRQINRRLAAAAERFGLAMGVGSQRIAIEDPTLEEWFQVRDVAPSVLLFANLGAAQLARGYGVEQARRAVAMIGADALFIHLNPLQEAVQGGNRDFRGVADRLALLCRELEREGIPVFAREVCFGMTEATARRLLECGVSGIDCSGAGGTSWARVEAHCAATARGRELGLRFGEWGIPTAESIVNVRRAAATLPLIASGGLRSGLDVAKAIALGADIGAMARPFLVKADEGEAPLYQFIEGVLEELRVCMFATGSATLLELRGKLRSVGIPATRDEAGGLA